MVKCLKTLIVLVYYILSDLFKCAARDKNYEQSFILKTVGCQLFAESLKSDQSCWEEEFRLWEGK